MKIIKPTEHHYRGFQIKGRETTTRGGYILGGRYFVEGGVTRNYLIVKDGMRYYKGCLISRLKDAKEIIDSIIDDNTKK
jgi:hypothetical protein